MKKLLKLILIILNVSVGFFFIAGAYTTTLDPEAHPRLVIAAMSLPFWIIFSAAILILDFFLLRKWCVWMALCFAFSLPGTLSLFPLNFSNGSVPEADGDRSWTLLQYNVSNFEDLTHEYVDDVNPALSYILAVDPDVAVLEEAHWLTEVKQFHITRAQLDSIHARYPYVIVGADITLLSKFPADSIGLKGYPNQLFNKSFSNSKAGCFIVDIHGQKTAIVGVHLQSLGLTREDKNIYEDFTNGQGLVSKSDLTEAKDDIISKIATANRNRAKHIKAIVEELENFDYDNIIVCGDFNDTPGCYSLNQLAKIGFREVYPLVGTGYMYTFNSDRLLFQIDHVLFKGNLFPWSMKRGDLRTSDHYPLITTFIQR